MIKFYTLLKISNKNLEDMNTLKPITLDNGHIQIHPYRRKELMREVEIIDELFEIFGNKESIPFNEE